MRKTYALPASFLAPPRRWLSIGMVALLIATALFAAVPAGNVSAAVCASQADGNWNDGATWSGCSGAGGVPAADDEITVNHAVAITADQPVGSLTIGAGGLVYFTTPATLTISGASGVFAVDGGVFAPEILDDEGNPTSPPSGGTVAFSAGAQQILTNGGWVDFWNLTKTASGTGQSLSFDPAVAGMGGVHIINNVTLTGADPNRLTLQSTVPGQQWQIWPDDAYTISFVAVSDSANVSPTLVTILVPDGVGLGNYTGWAFGTPDVALTSSANPAAEHAYVTLTATITPADVTGSVAFMDGLDIITNCAAQPVVSGVAACVTDNLVFGNRAITAVYSGDLSHASATSNVVNQVIGNLVQVVLTSQVNPAAAGALVTFQASITPADTVGSVKFEDGSDTICAAVAISAGKATCQVSLAAGTHNIRAEYIQGDVYSGIVTQVVKNLSTVTLASSHPFASFGQEITFTATVTDPTGVSGTFTFKRGNSNIPGCVNLPLTNNQAECAVTGLMPGSHNISVEYSGDATTFGLQPLAIVQNVDLIYFYVPIVEKN